MERGEVVVATAGKEKNQKFLISDVEKKYVYLVDGNRIKFSKPKKKSVKHIKCLNIKKFSFDEFDQKNENINSAIRKFLKN